jgi:hypothetical protein
MGAYFQSEHPRDVLPDQSGCSAHERGKCDQYGIDQCGHAQSHVARLCYDEGRHPKLYRRPRAAARGKGIRANSVAPGPIWTPLIPSTMPEEAVENFGKNVPMKRPGQPGRAGDGLRDACGSAIELRIRSDNRGHRRKTNSLTAAPARSKAGNVQIKPYIRSTSVCQMTSGDARLASDLRGSPTLRWAHR